MTIREIERKMNVNYNDEDNIVSVKFEDLVDHENYILQVIGFYNLEYEVSIRKETEYENERAILGEGKLNEILSYFSYYLYKRQKEFKNIGYIYF